MRQPRGVFAQPGRRQIFFLLRFLGLGLFAWTLATVDMSTVARSLESISAASVAIAILLCMVMLVIKAIKWRFMLAQVGVSTSLMEALGTYSNTTFWGTITPGRLGEFKRVWHLMRRHSLPIGRSTFLCLLDRGIDVFSVVSVSLAIGIIFPNALGNILSIPFLTVFLVACLTAAIFRRQLVAAILGLAPLVKIAAKSLQSPMQDVLTLRHRDIAMLVAMSVAGFACYAGMIWALLADLSLTLSVSMVIATIGATMISALIPISFFNLGPREIVLTALFDAYGLPPEDAISYSVLFIICYLIMMISSGGVGWLCLRLTNPENGER